jgi:hypothetical protein
MDWYLDRFRYTVPVSGVKINGWYKLRLEQTFEAHQKYIRYILNEGGRDGRFFYRVSCPPFLNRQGKILCPIPARKNWFQNREQRQKGYAIVRI